MGSEDQRIAAIIERNGWHAISIAGSPFGPFVYSCGLLTMAGHPELIALGLEPETGYSVLAVMVQEIHDGVSYRSRAPILGILEGRPVATRPIDSSHYPVFFGYALGHVRHVGFEGRFEALQVLWSDANGLLPQDLTCDPQVKQSQPLLHLPLTVSEWQEFDEWQ